MVDMGLKLCKYFNVEWHDDSSITKCVVVLCIGLHWGTNYLK